MKNGLGSNVNAGLKPLAQFMEAHGLMSESVSTDFHELRQGFIPPIQR